MKHRSLLLVLTLLFALFTPGCRFDCVAFEASARSFEELAKTTEQGLLVVLPPDERAAAQTAFDDAFAVLDTSIDVLDQVCKAIDAGLDGDLGAVKKGVSDAVNAIVALIDSYLLAPKLVGPTPPPGADTYPQVKLPADAQQALDEARQKQAELGQSAAED